MHPDDVCITPTRNDLGESLYWDAGGEVLNWINAWKAGLHAYRPVTGEMRRTEFADAFGGRRSAR